MRNNYSLEFENDMRRLAPTSTLDELLSFSLNNYNYALNRDLLRRFLSRRTIRYKDYKPGYSHGKPLPPGSEMSHGDGLIFIKTESGEWTYKQRYIYEKYYNVKLPKDVMVIFLDGDRTNYDIDNLMAVHTREYLLARNRHLISNDRESNRTAMMLGKIYYKIKEKTNET